MDTFLTIVENSKGEYKERKSSFLSFAFPVENENKVKDELEKIKKQFYDARHHCYAYKIGIEKECRTRAFDDREPAHTAGDMILGAIESANLTNVFIVVVRYFGGIKLGASNLSKAYRQAAAAAIDNAEIVSRTLQEDIVFDFEYSCVSAINRFFKENKIEKTSYTYLQANKILLKVDKDKASDSIARLSAIYGVHIL